jgi:hypothetical protein
VEAQPDQFRFVFSADGFLYLLPLLLTWVPGVAWARVCVTSLLSCFNVVRACTANNNDDLLL